MTVNHGDLVKAMRKCLSAVQFETFYELCCELDEGDNPMVMTEDPLAFGLMWSALLEACGRMQRFLAIPTLSGTCVVVEFIDDFGMCVNRLAFDDDESGIGGHAVSQAVVSMMEGE